MTRRSLGAGLPLGALLLTGLLGAACSPTVKVEAPDKPIVINLNVKIEQEVLVRLQRDVEQLIRDNPQDFPQPKKPGGQP